MAATGEEFVHKGHHSLGLVWFLRRQISHKPRLDAKFVSKAAATKRQQHSPFIYRVMQPRGRNAVGLDAQDCGSAHKAAAVI